jgi:hypothetical protein
MHYAPCFLGTCAPASAETTRHLSIPAAPARMHAEETAIRAGENCPEAAVYRASPIPIHSNFRHW